MAADAQSPRRSRTMFTFADAMRGLTYVHRRPKFRVYREENARPVRRSWVKWLLRRR